MGDWFAQSTMKNSSRSLLKRPIAIAVAVCAILALIVVRAFFDLAAQLLALGVLVSLLAGLLVAFWGQQADQQRHLETLLKRLEVPLALAPDPLLLDQYGRIVEAFARLAERRHPVLNDFAHYTIAQFVHHLDRISQGILEFDGTESWRAAYKELLNAPQVKSYRSVALIRQPEYWRDAAGEVSLQENLRLIHKGRSIERIAILGDEVWPADQPLFKTEVGRWLKRQADGAIKIYIVRDDALASAPDLRIDFGIYGADAVGIQEVDERARTKKFTFYFDATERQLAEQRWKRLLAYSRPLEEFIEP